MWSKSFLTAFLFLIGHSSHDDAYTNVLLRIAHATAYRHNLKIMIRTVHAESVVLALSASSRCRFRIYG